jgi:hypothetical protein
VRIATRVRRTAVLAIAAVGAVSLAACGSSPASVATTPTSAPTSGPALLPRKAVAPVSVVAQYFPQITVVARSGNDETATGEPIATRSVTFTNAGGTKKVTLSVDQFGGVRDAATAFHEAVTKSEAVTGFRPLTVPNVAQKTFAGTVTQGGETHVGLGALTGRLTIGVTLAGFAAGSANIDHLVSLSRAAVRNAIANAETGNR